MTGAGINRAEPVASERKRSIEPRNRPPFREEERRAARDAHHAERHDERRQDERQRHLLLAASARS